MIGGDLSLAGDVLLDPVREVVRRNAIPSAAEDTEIVAGVLGERAEMLGALALVMHESERFAAPGLSGGGMSFTKKTNPQPKGVPMMTQTQMRALLVALAALFAALAIGACGDDDDDGGDSGGDEGGGGTIAFLLPETQTARYEALDKPLFEAKVEELCPDCEIQYQNADQDPAKQQSAGRGRGHRGRRRDGPRPGRLDHGRRARDAGEAGRHPGHLVRPADPRHADLDYYVAFDSLEVGRQQATALSEQLAEDGNDTGPIVKINGDPKDNNAALFEPGLERGLRAGGRRGRPGVRHSRLAAGERPARDGAGDHGDRRGRDQGRLRRERRHRRWRHRRDEGERHGSDARSRSPARTPS